MRPNRQPSGIAQPRTSEAKEDERMSLPIAVTALLYPSLRAPKERGNPVRLDRHGAMRLAMTPWVAACC
jgi:hypothetical protein